MEKIDLDKLAFCCVVAVVGAVAITKPELSGDVGLSEGIIRWLFFVLACGLVINDQIGRPFKTIAITAVATSITLILVITFKSYMGDVIRLSGAEISVKRNPDVFGTIMIVLSAASFAGIIICSYARSVVISLLKGLFGLELDKAKKIENILNRIVSIGAAAAVIVFSII